MGISQQLLEHLVLNIEGSWGSRVKDNARNTVHLQDCFKVVDQRAADNIAGLALLVGLFAAESSHIFQAAVRSLRLQQQLSLRRIGSSRNEHFGTFLQHNADCMQQLHQIRLALVRSKELLGVHDNIIRWM